jgi:hypothetical protein
LRLRRPCRRAKRQATENGDFQSAFIRRQAVSAFRISNFAFRFPVSGLKFLLLLLLFLAIKKNSKYLLH